MIGLVDGEELEGLPVRRFTIRDVARLAETSISTVSASFSGAVKVAPETKRKVFAAANQLGWRPDRRASKLRQNETSLVGVVYQVDQPFQAAMVDALYLASKDSPLEIFLAGATEHNSELDCVRLLLAERCDAIVLTGATLADEQFGEIAQQVPTLSLCRAVRAGGVEVVQSDSTQGMKLLIDHLVRLGHANILHADLGEVRTARERQAGYVAAMTEHGLTEHIRILEGGDNVRDGVEAANRILKLQDLPTAITCYNDLFANGLIRQLQSRGISVPNDMSVVGFDGDSISRDPITSLTTVVQPIYQMAEDALRILEMRISAGSLVREGREQHLFATPSLAVGDSTGPVANKH